MRAAVGQCAPLQAAPESWERRPPTGTPQKPTTPTAPLCLACWSQTLTCGTDAQTPEWKVWVRGAFGWVNRPSETSVQGGATQSAEPRQPAGVPTVPPCPRRSRECGSRPRRVPASLRTLVPANALLAKEAECGFSCAVAPGPGSRTGPLSWGHRQGPGPGRRSPESGCHACRPNPHGLCRVPMRLCFMGSEKCLVA